MFTRRSRIQGANLTSSAVGKKRTDKKIKQNSTLEKLENRLLLSTSYQLQLTPVQNLPAISNEVSKGTNLYVVPNTNPDFANDIIALQDTTAGTGRGQVILFPYSGGTYGAPVALYNFDNGGANGGSQIYTDSLYMDPAGDLLGATENGAGTTTGTIWELTAANVSADITTPGSVAPTYLEVTQNANANVGNGTVAQPFNIAQNQLISSLESDSSGDLFFNTFGGGFSTNGSSGTWELKNSGTIGAPVYVAGSAELVIAQDNFNSGQAAYGMAIDQANGTLYDIEKVGGFTNYFSGGTNGEAGYVISATAAQLQTAYNSYTSQGVGTPLKATNLQIVAAIDLALKNTSNVDNDDWALAVDSNHDLWGMTAANGSLGMVFEVTPAELAIEQGLGNTGVAISTESHAALVSSNFNANLEEVAPVALFNAGSGYNDTAGFTRGEQLLIDTYGDVFAVTGNGGANNTGNLFEIPAGTNNLVTVASLPAAGALGTIPNANVVMNAQGNIYFATSTGGANNMGTLVQVTDAFQLGFNGVATTIATGGLALPQFTVAVEDQYNNTIVADTTVVTLSVGTYSGTGSGLLSGTLTAAAVNGIATFSNVRLDNSGTYTLAATDNTDVVNGIAITGTSTTSTVVSESLDFTTEPVNTTAGVAFSTVVSVEDANGNVVAGDNTGVVVLSINSGPVGGVFGGTHTLTLNAGVASFTGLTETKSGTYTLIASDTIDSIATGPSSSFVVSPSTATKLVQLNGPSSMSAGQLPSQPLLVAIEDSFGNIETADNSTVSIAVDSFTGSGTAVSMGGTMSTAASNGVATFSSFTMSGQGLFTVTLGATDTADFGATNFPIPPAIQLSGVNFVYSFANNPNPAGLQGSNIQIDIETSNAVNTSDNTSVITLSLSSGPGTFGVGSTLTAMAVNGIVTFSNITLDTPGSYAFFASDAPEGQVNVLSPSYVVSPGLTFNLPTTNPIFPGETVVAGTPGPLLVNVVDQSGVNIVTADTSSTVTLSIATGPINYFDDAPGLTTLTVQVVNGIATFTGFFLSAVGAYTFNATDTADGISGSEASGTLNVTSNPTTTNSLIFSTISNGTAGTNIPTFTVTLDDPYGNTVTGDSSVIALTIDTGPGTVGGTITAVAINGVATFSGVNITTAGDYQLYAADSADGITQEFSNIFTISPGAANPSDYVIVGLTSGFLPNATAGGNISVTVDIEDSFGNIVPTAVPVNLGIVSPGTIVGATTVTSSNGVAVFTGLNIDTVGTFTLEVGNTAFAPLVASFTVATHTSTPGNGGITAEAGGGIGPTDLAVDSSGDVFGLQATTNNGGIIWEIPNGGSFKILINSGFYYQPGGMLTLDTAGDIFVTDKSGPNSGTPVVGGQVFELTFSGGSYAAGLTGLPSPTGGAGTGHFANADYGVVVGASGDVFGIDEFGGANAKGDVWEVPFSGGSYQPDVIYYSFNNASPTDMGNQPSGIAIDSKGDIFVTTHFNNGGELYEIANTGTLVAPAYAPLALIENVNYNDGQPANGLYIDPSGNIWVPFSGAGGATGAGAFGAIEEFTAASGYSTGLDITGFGTSGYDISTGLTFDSSGDAFGVGYTGGANNNGNVFEVAAGSTVASTIYSFSASGSSDGIGPVGLVFDPQTETLFGETVAGGATNDGAVFEIIPFFAGGPSVPAAEKAPIRVTAGAPTHLAVVNQPANTSTGANTTITVAVEDQFNDIVTTSAANINLSLNAGTNGFNAVAAFNSPGSGDQSQMISDSSGDVFGISSTSTGGGVVSIFEVTKAGVYKVLATQNTGFNGDMPQGPLFLDSSNNLWYITKDAGGDIYEVKSTGVGTWATTATLVATMNNSAISSYNDVSGGVIVDGFGNIFGADTFASSGDVWEFKNHGTIAGPIYEGPTLVHAFTFGADGGQPVGHMAIDSNGDIFGTTRFGPASSNVFELKNGGSLTAPVYTFVTVDQIPYGDGQPGNGVWLDPEGDLLISESGAGGAPLGTTGALLELAWNGTAFAATPTVLHFFNGGAGGNVPVGLTFDSSGDLYGATPSGDANGNGSVFEVHGASGSYGSLTTLYSFVGPYDGTDPSGVIFNGTSLYGDDVAGGPNGAGVVFDIGGAAGGGLSGTLSKFATSNGLASGTPTGEATFSVAVASVGTYTLRASSSTVPPATRLVNAAIVAATVNSNSFVVSTGNATQLVPVTTNRELDTLTVTGAVTSGEVFTLASGALQSVSYTVGATPTVANVLSGLLSAWNADADIHNIAQGLVSGNTLIFTSAYNNTAINMRISSNLQQLQTLTITDTPTAGESYSITDNGQTVSYTTTLGDTPTTVAATLAAAWDANGILDGLGTATASGGAINFTSQNYLKLNTLGQFSDSGVLSAVFANAGAALNATFKLENSAGGVVVTDESTVHLALTGIVNPNQSVSPVPASDGSLGGVLTAVSINGIATFSAATANLKSGTYQIKATDGAYSATADLVVFPGAISKLVFSSQPTTATAGQLMTFVVEQEDSGGNIVTTPEQIALTIAPGSAPAGGTMGTQETGSVNGFATFSAVVLTRAGSYKLKANTDGTVPQDIGTSAAVTVNNAAYSKLVMSHNPITTGAVLAPLPNMAQGPVPVVYIALEDQYGNVCTTGANNASLVSITKFTGPPDSVIGGTTLLAAHAGVATFNTMTLTTQGQYVLRATSVGKTVNSAAFSVRTNVPAKVAFLTEPGNNDLVSTSVGTVEIAVENSFGDIITGSVSTVTMALTPFGPSNPTGTVLGGTATAKTVAGIATFTNLTVSNFGTYELKATSGNTPHSTAISTLMHVGDAAVFTQMPTTIANGTVQVSIEDANVVQTNYTSVVTLAISSELDDNTPWELKANGATTLTAQAVAGVATFNVSILTTNDFGTAAGLPDAGTYTFQATGAQIAPSQLSPQVAFNYMVVTNSATAPATLLPTSGLTPNNVVTVEVVPGFGSLHTLDNTDTITLAIDTESVAGATLTGTVTAVTVNGVAHFTVAEQIGGVDKPGTYTFIATSSNTFLAGLKSGNAIVIS